MAAWRDWFTATGMAEFRQVISRHVDRLGRLRPYNADLRHGGPDCHYCADQRFVLETGPLGLIPISCPECNQPKRKQHE